MPFVPSSRLARRVLRIAAHLGVALGLVSCADLPAGRAIRIGTAGTSHAVCSNHFIGHQNPDTVYQEEVAPDGGMKLLGWGIRVQVDDERKEVTTRLAGLFENCAVYREGLGCTVLHGDAVPPALDPRDLPPRLSDPDDGFAPPQAVTAQDPALRAAIDQAFAEPGSAPFLRTKAVVVVHRGRVVGERYEPGIGVDTALHGHSMTKSVSNALVGVLTRDGRLKPGEPGQIKAWDSPADPRRVITIDQLLRNSSGLAFDEYAGGWDPASRMWFTERDMSAYAATAHPEAVPGTRWAYSDLGFMLVSRAVRDATGGNAGSFLRYAHRELFDPAGMRHVSFEFDETGTPLGPSHMYASARDWARFGLLYLNDGVAGGKRILPEGWVRETITPKIDAGYGSGFWLNTTSAPNSLCGNFGMPGAPADAYFARGYLGQYTVVVPSRQLVIVRLGVSFGHCGRIAEVGQLVKGVVQAIDASAAVAQSSLP